MPERQCVFVVLVLFKPNCDFCDYLIRIICNHVHMILSPGLCSLFETSFACRPFFKMSKRVCREPLSEMTAELAGTGVRRPRGVGRNGVLYEEGARNQDHPWVDDMEVSQDMIQSTGILDIPQEIITIILRHLNVFEVSCLSLTCRQLRTLVTRDELRVAAYRELPGMDVYNRVNGLSVRRPLNKECLIFYRVDKRRMRMGLSLALKDWANHFRLLYICSSSIRDIGEDLLAECISSMEVVIIEGGSLRPDMLETVFAKMILFGRVRKLVMMEQRHMACLGLAAMRAISSQMVQVVLPMPGSAIDGITQDQIMSLLKNSGRLERLTLVTYWELSDSPLDLEMACLMAHLDNRRGVFQRCLARSHSYFGVTEGSRRENWRLPAVEQVTILSIGQGHQEVMVALCYTWGTPAIQLMNSLQSMTQMGRIGVPRSVSQQLSFRGWTRIMRADYIRQEWLTSGHPYSIGSMLPMMCSADSFNPAYSASVLALFLPL